MKGPRHVLSVYRFNSIKIDILFVILVLSNEILTPLITTYILSPEASEKLDIQDVYWIRFDYLLENRNNQPSNTNGVFLPYC